MKRPIILLLTTAVLTATSLLTTQCVRRPLVDVGNTHYVRVYLDEEIKNVTTGFYNPALDKPDYSTPEILRVVLYDQTSNRIAAERYLRNRKVDARGVYYDGYIVAEPGDYRLLTYNFGTESTIIDQSHLYLGATAYTNEISSVLRQSLSVRAEGDEERIVYIPDHLFVDRNEELTLDYGMDVDTLRDASGDHFTAGSIVLSYYLQVRVKGAQWISSAVGLLTGMAGSATLHDGNAILEDPVTIYFEMQRGEVEQGSDEAFIYTTFHTFGKLPDQNNELQLTFDVRTTDGRALTTTIDITDEFSKPDAIEHQWLLLDTVLTIPEPEEPTGGGDGFVPEVDDWEDIETDIII